MKQAQQQKPTKDEEMNMKKMSYDRAMELLKTCLDWLADDSCECAEMINRMRLLSLTDDEIKMLGYGYLFDVKEDG